jgi:hypothetical protein
LSQNIQIIFGRDVHARPDELVNGISSFFTIKLAVI